MEGAPKEIVLITVFLDTSDHKFVKPFWKMALLKLEELLETKTDKTRSNHSKKPLETCLISWSLWRLICAMKIPSLMLVKDVRMLCILLLHLQSTNQKTRWYLLPQQLKVPEQLWKDAINMVLKESLSQAPSFLFTNQQTRRKLSIPEKTGLTPVERMWMLTKSLKLSLKEQHGTLFSTSHTMKSLKLWPSTLLL